MRSVNEKIPFRLFHLECCGHLLCWINSRYPTYCPECGKSIYLEIKSSVAIVDLNAHIRYRG